MQPMVKPIKKLVFGFLLLGAAGGAFAATFADLAVLLGRGYFGGYLDPEAPLEQCVVFLNRQGICFSFFDIMDTRRKVTQEDVARVVGQAMLLFSGEARIEAGCIKKPLEAETWVDYCLLNDVDSGAILDRVFQRTADGSLPEVQRFFKR